MSKSIYQIINLESNKNRIKNLLNLIRIDAESNQPLSDYEIANISIDKNLRAFAIDYESPTIS